MLPTNSTRTLVLNADFTPLSTIGWQDAITRLYKEAECENCSGDGNNGAGEECYYCQGAGILPSAITIDVYDMYLRDGKGNKHFVPAVIKNQNQCKRTFRKPPFSRLNIFRRDGFTCQYCGHVLPARELELEHVVPRSKWNGNGTPTCWTNIVTACRPCNRKKADLLLAHLDMKLFRVVDGQKIFYDKPKQPNYNEFVLGLSPLDSNIPAEWKPYLSGIK